MRKVLFISVAIIFIVATAAFLYTRIQPKAPQPTAIIPITTIAPLSTLPRKIESAPIKTAFTYSGPDPVIPSQLATYVVSYSTDLPAKTASLAKQWAFINQVKNPVTYVYDWIDDNKELTYNDQAKSISFSLFTKPAQNSLLASLTPQNVFSILTQQGYFSNFFSFSESSRQIIQGQGEGDSSAWGPVTVITYESSPTNQQIPFFFTGVSRATGEIRVSQQGNVISFSFFITPRVQTEQSRQTLNTTSQILMELNNQKGYLSGLETNVLAYPFEEAANFDAVAVSSISIAYLFIPEQSRFVPIAVVEGAGNGSSPQRVRYYVRISS